MSTDDLRQVFAANLRRLATEKRLSLNHLADRAGLNRAAFYRILGAEVSATLTTVAQLAEALEVPAHILLQPGDA